MINMAKKQRVYTPKDNHIKIRVIEPDPVMWLDLVKKGKNFIATMPSKPGATKFIVLDIGRGKATEKKARGIWMVRGVLEGAHDIGDTVDPSNWTTQSIRVEYKSFNSSSDDTAAKKIQKLKRSKYWKIVRNFMEREYGVPLMSINVVEKTSGDFKLEMKFKK